MTIFEYMKDRIGALLINLAGLLALSLYLAAANVDVSMILLIAAGWIVVLLVYFSCGYIGRR